LLFLLHPGCIRSQTNKGALKKKSEWQAIYVFGVFLLVFLIVYNLRAPFHRRTKQFADHVTQGVQLWNQGNLDAAEREVREALRVRPDQASGHSILAQLQFQKKNLAEARKEAEAALAINSTQRDALMLLSTLDIKEQRWKDAMERAAYGNSIYPDRPEFLYLRGMAEKTSKKIR
jgi:Tfp pilus assembly protein PilF